MKVKKNISEREAQVISLMLLGLKSKDVATVLNLSEKTIGTYLRRWKEYLCAPLVSNYIALTWVIPLLDGQRNYTGVLPKYEALINQIIQSRSPQKINSLIKQIQNYDNL